MQMFRFLALTFLLLGAAPLSAKSITVRMGEAWIFTIVGGQPANAHKVAAATAPASGEIKVTVQHLMGTTMTLTNNSKFDYSYRAVLILPDGKAGPAKSCAVPANARPALESWPTRAFAIRLSHFRPAPAGSLCP